MSGRCHSKAAKADQNISKEFNFVYCMNNFSNLDPSEKQLVRLMQKMRFGQIKDLMVEDGLPIFQPKPCLIENIRLGKNSPLSDEFNKENFSLKPQVKSMFNLFRSRQNIKVRELSVQDGLPNNIQLESDFLWN